MSQKTDAINLAQWFNKSLQPKRIDAWPGSDEELGYLLAEFINRAKAKWPSLAVSEQEFVGYLAKCIGEMPLAEALSNSASEDLWLAFAALKHDARALYEFSRLLRNIMNFKENRLDLSVTGRKDFLQQLSESLLVGSKHGGPPKLVHYSGTGTLKGWIRVVFMREKLRLLKKRKKESDRSVVVQSELLTNKEHPEMACLKNENLVLLRSALHRSINNLKGEDRLLLGYWLVDRMTLKQIGDVFNNHRLTIGRRLNKLKKRLLVSIKSDLARQHRLEESEIRSLFRNFGSEFDASLCTVLAERKISSEV